MDMGWFSVNDSILLCLVNLLYIIGFSVSHARLLYIFSLFLFEGTANERMKKIIVNGTSHFSNVHRTCIV